MDPERAAEASAPPPAVHETSGRAAWGKYPSPPSSGRKVVSVRSQDKRPAAVFHAEAPPASRQDAKRPRRYRTTTGERQFGILTPPNTRDTRLEDRYGLPGPSSASSSVHASRHTRHHSDSFNALLSPSVARHRRHAASISGGGLPVRDTPHNPFLEGGPADIGFTGPYRERALHRAASLPPKDPGAVTYVLYVPAHANASLLTSSRGQRVVCAEQSEAERAPDAPSPAEPCRLFPSNMPPPLQRSAMEHELRAPVARNHRGRGLFAEELEERRRLAPPAPLAAADNVPRNGQPTAADPDAAWLAQESAAERMQPRTMTLRPPVDPTAGPPALSRANRDLLAKLDRVNWSSDEEDG